MFKKVSFLGEGSFGVVHRAMSPSGAWFAVKSSPLDMSFSLEKERRIYANFHGCPEIIQCFCNYSSVEEGSRRYNLVLEFASGGSLSDLMSRYPGRRLPEPDVREVTRTLLRGLSRIHRFGYVHCDLKPDNVMVFLKTGPDGRVVKQVKLADFGLAKEPNSGENHHRPGEFRGTPWYMSPESVAWGQVDAKLDIWSLGCVVMEMVTGRPAYASVRDKYDLIWKLGMLMELPTIPENMSLFGKDFLMRCFAVDPNRRWTADELLAHPFITETWTPRMSSRLCFLGSAHHILSRNMTTNLHVL